MALNRLLCATALAGLLAGSAWLGQDAAANFADSAGFSGRGNATCVACHTEAPFPLAPPPATAVLEGLPEAWEPGATSRLTIRVEGGPPALPRPQPQGGFDLAVDAGTLTLPEAFAAVLRTPGPQEATYKPEGTLMREWQVDWTAPGLEEAPRPARFWLAVLAANGNHVITTNASDGGERLDSAAHLVLDVAPSPAAHAAWLALPLAAPEAEATTVEPYVLVAGRHLDGNATAVAWRADGGAWQSRDTGPEWRLRLDGLAPGRHALDYRSEGAGRASPEQRLAFDVPGFAVGLPGGRDAPAPGAGLLAVLALALAAIASFPLRRPRP